MCLYMEVNVIPMLSDPLPPGSNFFLALPAKQLHYFSASFVTVKFGLEQEADLTVYQKPFRNGVQSMRGNWSFDNLVLVQLVLGGTVLP